MEIVSLTEVDFDAPKDGDLEMEEEELPTTKGSQNEERDKHTGSTWNKFTHRSSD